METTPVLTGDVKSPQKKCHRIMMLFLNNQYQSVPGINFGNGIANMTAMIWSLQKA